MMRIKPGPGKEKVIYDLTGLTMSQNLCMISFQNFFKVENIKIYQRTPNIVFDSIIYKIPILFNLICGQSSLGY